MSGFSIDASEVRALALDLSGAPARVQRLAPRAVRKTIHDIEADAKATVPVDTGHLRSSISSDMDGDGLGGRVGPTANYGGYVEYGTSKMSAQPYMGPAFDRQVPGLLSALGDAGEQAIES